MAHHRDQLTGGFSRSDGRHVDTILYCILHATGVFSARGKGFSMSDTLTSTFVDVIETESMYTVLCKSFTRLSAARTNNASAITSYHH
jgi:hypothetical protein